MIDIGGLISGGFDVLRRRPLSVLAWAALLILGGLAISWASAGLLGIDLGAMLTNPRAYRPSLAQTLGSYAIDLLGVVLSAIVSAAALRTVLRPEERGFAALRLGMDEVRIVGMTLLIYVLSVAAGLFGALILAFLASLSGLVSGGNPLVAGGVGAVLAIALFCGVLFVVVRLSLIYPLVLVRRRIGIDESWELTRGHFWSLFGAYILMALISLLIMLIVMLPVLGSLSREAMTTSMATFQSSTVAITEGRITEVGGQMWLLMIAGGVLKAVMVALWSGMAATATLQLRAAEAAETPEYP